MFDAPCWPRGPTMLSGEELARAVLKAKDRYALLSLGSAVPVVLTADGYLNLEDEEVRKCYMKIASRIHPDKLPGCSDATKAFQTLVRAYELCCKPELRADDSDDSRDEDDDDDDEEEEEEEDDDDEDDEDEDEDEDEVVAQIAAQTQAPPARSKVRANAPTGAAASAPKTAAAKKAKKKKADSSDDDDFDDDDDDDDSDDSDFGDEKPRSRKLSPRKPAPTAPTAPAAPKPPKKKPSAKTSAKADSKASAKTSAKASSKASAKPSAKRHKGTERSGGAVGAYRTGVRCPRCHSEWGAHLKVRAHPNPNPNPNPNPSPNSNPNPSPSPNPNLTKGEGREPLYTQFMRGRTQVHCLGCLLEFGCLTASHHCPCCARAFEYRPELWR